ncbi:MAG: adenylate/guanylate cyclase domain-containing protein [Candidatus Omnitrophota bacterium]
MDKKKYSKFLVSLGFSFSVALLLLLLTPSKIYQILELKALDLRFALRGTQPVDAPVLHIDIDDQSLEKLGRWPWPRSYHAGLTDTLAECGAKQILWDVLFMEEYRESPQDDVLFARSMASSSLTYMPFYFVEDQVPPEVRLKELLLKDITLSLDDASKALAIKPELLKDKLSAGKKFVMDEAVSAVLKNAPGITEDEVLKAIENQRKWFLFPSEEGYIRGIYKNQKLVRHFADKYSLKPGQGGWPYAKTYQSLSSPIRQYVDALKGSGFINADPDVDGVTRRIPLFIKYEDKILPQLAVRALMDSLDVKGVEAKPYLITLKGALAGDRRSDIRIPVDNTGCMFVNWSGKWGASFYHIPYYLILRLHDVRQQLAYELAKGQDAGGRGSAELEYLKNSEQELRSRLTVLVKGKICIVGLTATGTHDLRAIPLQASYPMVGTHANLINTISSGRFILHGRLWIEIFIFLLTALVAALGSLAKLWKSLLVSISYALGYFILTFILFDKFGWWVDLIGPEGIVIFSFAGITSFRYFTEEREKAWIKHAFGHYLSPSVINELVDNPSSLKLGGERRSLTVIFSDVRGFTTFSESRQPEEVVAMLNELLTEQVKVVFKYQGTLDKFVGDELMAFFGAPGNIHKDDHALAAVRTAIDIQAKLKEIQQKRVSEGKQPLQIGVGINTGDMVVGNMGSLERMDYTVIGDNVNLAARLCSAAGKDEIIISEATYEQVKDHIDVDKLEPITVKGKVKPISIYRVKGVIH